MDTIFLDRGAAAAMLPARSSEGAKWDFGRLLAICGSESMPGAAVLACSAAARSGAGLVRLAAVPQAAGVVAAHLAECTYLPLLCEDGHISARSLPVLLGEAESYPALLFGPGLGRSEDTGELLRALITQYRGTLIVDADGLNALCGGTDALTRAAGEIILTPHIFEMARLSGRDAEDIRRDPGGSAAVFAETHGVTVVLKGSVTHIAGGGALYANDRPNSGLAKGGSGDVLAGLIAGLAAQGAEPLHAAAAGVFVHSLAGALTAESLGRRGMLPSDTAAMIPHALRELEK